MSLKQNIGPKVIDDLARLAGGGLGVLADMRMQIRQEIRSYIDDLAMRMDFVPREDFERLELMTQKQAEQIQAIEKKLEKLEAKK